MSSAERLHAAPALTLKVAADGELIASTPSSRTAMGLDGLVIISAFAQPATRDDAYAQAAQTFELPRPDFDAMVAGMIDAGILVTPTPSPVGSDDAGLAEQLSPLRDLGWLLAYRGAVERAAAGKIVVDLTGAAGLLAVLAAKAGARKVYAMTPGAQLAAVREVLAANGVEDRVECVTGEDVPERGELLLHDLVSASPFAKLAHLERLRARVLVPDAALIPHRLDLSFVGVDVTHADDLAEDRTAAELGRLLGLELAPLAARLARQRTRQPMTGPVALAPRHLITGEQPFVSIDLRRPWREQVPATSVPIELAVTSVGRFAGVAGLVRVHLDDRTAVGNHPAMPSCAIRHAWYGLRPQHAMYLQPRDRMALVARVERGEIVVELG